MKGEIKEISKEFSINKNIIDQLEKGKKENYIIITAMDIDTSNFNDVMKWR